MGHLYQHIAQTDPLSIRNYLPSSALKPLQSIERRKRQLIYKKRLIKEVILYSFYLIHIRCNNRQISLVFYMQFCLIVSFCYLQWSSDLNAHDEGRSKNLLPYTFYTLLKRNICIDLMKFEYIFLFVILISAQKKNSYQPFCFASRLWNSWNFGSRTRKYLHSLMYRMQSSYEIFSFNLCGMYLAMKLLAKNNILSFVKVTQMQKKNQI